MSPQCLLCKWFTPMPYGHPNYGKEGFCGNGYGTPPVVPPHAFCRNFEETDESLKVLRSRWPEVEKMLESLRGHNNGL